MVVLIIIECVKIDRGWKYFMFVFICNYNVWSIQVLPTLDFIQLLYKTLSP